MKFALILVLVVFVCSGTNAEGVTKEQIEHLLDITIKTVSFGRKCHNPPRIPSEKEYTYESDNTHLQIKFDDLKLSTGDMRIKSKEVKLTDTELDIKMDLVRELPYVEGDITATGTINDQASTIKDYVYFSFGNLSSHYWFKFNIENSIELTDFAIGDMVSEPIKILGDFERKEISRDFVQGVLQGLWSDYFVKFNSVEKADTALILNEVVKPKMKGKTLKEYYSERMSQLHKMPTKCSEILKDSS